MRDKTNIKKKILVTGGGGFLGKAIVKKLVDRGDLVSSFSRKYYPELDTLGVKQIQGDIFDEHAVDKACKDIELVFHVAAKAGICGTWETFFNTNVRGTENIVKACLKNKVKRLIHTSSPSVVFDGNDMEGANESTPFPDKYHAPYPETKAMAEKIIQKATSKELLTITLRPHLIWGPGDNHLLPAIIARAKRLKRVGNGKNMVDTIYIDNAAHAHVLAGDKLKENPSLSGNVYFISQDEPILLWKIVDEFLIAAGLPPVKNSVSASTAIKIGIIVESLFKFFKIKKEPPITEFMAKELATSHWFDISRAKKDLGYHPEVSIEQGIERLNEWLDSQKQQFSQ